MDSILRLQIKQLVNVAEEIDMPAEPIAPKHLLKDNLEISYQNGQFYLLQENEPHLLQAGDTVGNENFIFTVQVRDEKVAIENESADVETVEHDNVIPEATFALAELNREDTRSELDTLMQIDGDDPLAFLFASKVGVAQQNFSADMPALAAKKDPLALLNEYFQPPQATNLTEAINVMQPADILPINEFGTGEGNILRDLGFLMEETYYERKPVSLMQMSLEAPICIGYRNESE